MSKDLLIITATIGAAFVFGFVWGQGARKNAQSNVKTDMTGGVVTIEVDAGQAVKQGLYDLFG
jgi:hypothetical protein